IERAIAERPALEVERLVYESGGLAVAARTSEQWKAERVASESGRLADTAHTTEQSRAQPGTGTEPMAASESGRLADTAHTTEQSGAQPVVTFGSEQLGDGGPLVAITGTGGRRAQRAVPRVLDLTRVIAGPVGTRMLAALGADVLRVDDPNRPELPLHAVDGVIGKASALVDASTPDGLEALHRLAGQADVVVTGYRPGAM